MNAEVLCHRDDAEEILLEDILSVSRNGWKHGEGIAISSREETTRFFEFLTRIAGKNGWLMVWILRIDGRAVAMEYDLEHKGVVYALRSDFDEALKECSPGSYLEYRIAKYLFENGYKEYNTGPGMNTYKLHWTEQSKENVMLTVYNRTLPGVLAYALEGRLVPFIKRFRNLKTRKT
jgi:CelD/BcsL family acetyltransferase involved in cellulose biosynthesis